VRRTKDEGTLRRFGFEDNADFLLKPVTCHKFRLGFRDLQPSGYYPPPAGDGNWPRRAQSLSNAEIRRKREKIMVGFVMVLALVLVTVVSPFAVMARVKSKSRQK
jgi:hypothetical protein